jgi:hypothetical protein
MSSPMDPASSSAQASPLDGEWRMPYTCEENVRTFQRNVYLDHTESMVSSGLSPAVNVKKYSRDFAWGPNAKTGTPLTPETLYKGAPDRVHIMRIEGGYITEDPGTIGLVGTIEVVGDRTIKVRDAYDNIDTVDTFSFRLEGGKLRLTQKGLYDAWQGTWLEEAPWFRSN